MLYARGRQLNDVDVLMQVAKDAGARVVLITGFLGVAYANLASVVLETSDSREGHTREALAASTVTDALTLALADRNETKAIGTSRRLSSFRQKLIGSPKKPRGKPRKTLRSTSA